MKNHNDHRPVDGFSTTGSVLQYLFALIEIDDCLFVLLLLNTGHALCVKLLDMVSELLYIWLIITIVVGELQQLCIRKLNLFF